MAVPIKFGIAFSLRLSAVFSGEINVDGIVSGDLSSFNLQKSSLMV